MIPEGQDIKFAAKCIAEGKLVAFPTETVYGLGADAFNPVAVAKIFEAKKRPSFDPLIVHIANVNQIEKGFESPVDERVYKLAEAFWPGPLTLVCVKNKEVPDIVTSGLNTVGLRMPNHKTALELIQESGTAIAAPSANRFGMLSPTMASHVQKQLNDVDYLLDGGATHYGIESTVMSLVGHKPVVLRPGAITLDQIKKILPEAEMLGHSDIVSDLPSPGLLKSHYSPQKPLFIGLPQHEAPPASGFICFIPGSLKINADNVIYLTQDGNMYHAAANLFIALHQMEENPDVEQIFIEAVNESGLGIAIMDRIKKAAFRFL